MRRRVAKANQHSLRAALLQQGLTLLVQNHKGLAALFASHFHVMPPKLRANARPERLRNRFLCRKPRRQERPRHPVRQTVTDLVRMQNAMGESLAELVKGALDAGHFNYVNADAEYHLLVQGPKSKVVARQAAAAPSKGMLLFGYDFICIPPSSEAFL